MSKLYLAVESYEWAEDGTRVLFASTDRAKLIKHIDATQSAYKRDPKASGEQWCLKRGEGYISIEETELI